MDTGKARLLVAACAAAVSLAALASREGFVFKGRIDFLEPETEYDAEFLFYSGDSATPGYGRRARVKTDAQLAVNCVVSDALAEMAEPPSGEGYRTKYTDYLLDCANSQSGMEVEMRVDMGNGSKKSTQRQKVAPVPFASQVVLARSCTGDFTATDGTLSFKTVSCGRLSVAGEGASIASLTSVGADMRGDVVSHGVLTLNAGQDYGRAITVGGNVYAKGEKASISCATEFPVGAIIAWTEKDLPSGDEWKGVWAVCDGQLGTPDLRDRFVVGAGASGYDDNTVGGLAEVTIDSSTYPSHTHSFTIRYPKYTTYGMNDWFGRDDDVWGNGTSGYTADSSTWSGGTAAHNNLPPYCNVVFIQRIR